MPANANTVTRPVATVAVLFQHQEPEKAEAISPDSRTRLDLQAPAVDAWRSSTLRSSLPGEIIIRQV